MPYFALFSNRVDDDCICFGFIKCEDVQEDLFLKSKTAKEHWAQCIIDSKFMENHAKFSNEAVEVFYIKHKDGE